MGCDIKPIYAGADGILPEMKENEKSLRLFMTYHFPSISNTRSRNEADFIMSMVLFFFQGVGRCGVWNLLK